MNLRELKDKLDEMNDEQLDEGELWVIDKNNLSNCAYNLLNLGSSDLAVYVNSFFGNGDNDN